MSQEEQEDLEEEMLKQAIALSLSQEKEETEEDMLEQAITMSHSSEEQEWWGCFLDQMW